MITKLLILYHIVVQNIMDAFCVIMRLRIHLFRLCLTSYYKKEIYEIETIHVQICNYCSFKPKLGQCNGPGVRLKRI